MTPPSYRADRTALIIVDVLNDFLAEDGQLNAAIAPMLEKVDFTRNVERLLSGARAAGVQVYYAPHGIDEHSFDDIKHVLPVWQNALTRRILWIGSHGDDFYPPLRPHDGDIVLAHHRMFNSFFGSDLHDRLQKAGVENVVMAGLTAETCVEGTGRHALEAGYHLTFLRDAVAEFTDAAHNAALDISYPTFGHAVLTVDEFLAAVELK